MNSGRKRVHLAERLAQRLRETEDPGAPILVLPPDSEAGAEPPPVPPAEPAVDPVLLDTRAKEDVAAPESTRERLTVKGLEGAGMVVSRIRRNRISEEFRVAGQAIRRTMAKDANRPNQHHLVMVTSAKPGEGKSFAALNLAASLALDGDKPVLLVDADSKRNSISQILGFGTEPGLLDFGVSPTQLANVVTIRSQVENLSFLPIGGRAGTTGFAQVTVEQPIALIVEKLAQRFLGSVIVLDAPPCLSSSDAAALAPVVGQVVLVVEAERTQRSEVEAALDIVDACPNINLLLNKTKLMTTDAFGAYS